jgi:hypothetical protein
MHSTKANYLFSYFSSFVETKYNSRKVTYIPPMSLLMIRLSFQIDNRKMMNENCVLQNAGERIIRKIRSECLHSEEEIKEEGDQ